MYKTILVPLDGSKRAEAILPHVEGLAQRYSATVIFLRVTEPVPVVLSAAVVNPAVYTRVIELEMNEAKSYLAKLQSEFRDKGIESRTLVVFGSVVATILEIAKREDADLIAMASHGRSGLGRVFYGSVAAGVLHGVDRPLLLIRSAENM